MSRRIVRSGKDDYDFLNTQAPTCNDFSQLMSHITGHSLWCLEAPGSRWHCDMLLMTSPLAHFSAVLDGYTDEMAEVYLQVHLSDGMSWAAMIILRRRMTSILSVNIGSRSRSLIKERLEIQQCLWFRHCWGSFYGKRQSLFTFVLAFWNYSI